MLANNCFQDMEIALMMHGAPETTTDIKSLALTNIKVTYKGKSAHAALKPEQGRSALDGLLLLCQGIEFLREHVKNDVKMHYVINNGGDAPNVVPRIAEGRFSLRSYHRIDLDEVVERFKKIVKGAALMTETESEAVVVKALDNKIPVIKLNNVLMDNAKLLDAPNLMPPRQQTGSTDFGNVMYIVPGSCIRVAFVPPGTSSHSEDFLRWGKTAEANRAIILAAKILAATCYDLISDKELLSAIKKEFLSNKQCGDLTNYYEFH